MNPDPITAASRIAICGHRGLVGSALVRRLSAEGYRSLLTQTHEELDLTDASAVAAWFEEARPEHVILAAAKVGGIQANQAAPADFITENLLIETSVLGAARRVGVKRLIFFGSTCTYPKANRQPMREEDVTGGGLEPTSAPYAVAKIAGMRMCEAYNRQHGTLFVSVIPATLYGPQDNFDPAGSHVISGLMRRMHDAKLAGAPMCPIWGSGRARREFLYVDDVADACLFLLRQEADALRAVLQETGSILNAGSGEEIAIADLAQMIRAVVGYEGRLEPDPALPDGAPRKLLDSRRLCGLGWRPSIKLTEGIRRTYEWYLETANDAQPAATR